MFKKILLLALVLAFLISIKQSLAQSSGANVNDAIAVRIIPNPNHYSIARWYEVQGFQGSPQALMVDGYEAIRDGRTVYVNATDFDLSGHKVSTNIYLISYNQDQTVKTVDILGQLVSHWKFNKNLTTENFGTCGISSLNCEQDADCSNDSLCATSTAGSASSSCVLKEAVNCANDEECPANYFCNSVKAKVSRDVIRVGKVRELQGAIDNYKSVNNHFPSLAGGTYLSNFSISVWPSWSQVLLSAIGAPQSLVDPINRLGNCTGYDVKTCWDDVGNKFVIQPAADSDVLRLPPGSYALAYHVASNGLSDSLCTTFEGGIYKLDPAPDPVINDCQAGTGLSGTASNSAPVLTHQSLTGIAGQPFNGYVEVTDPDGDLLTWTLGAGCGGGLVLQETGNPNQKKLVANNVITSCNPNLTVNDGHGHVPTFSLSIVISSPAPIIEADDGEYTLNPSPLKSFGYSFMYSSSFCPADGCNYTITPPGLYTFHVFNTGITELIGTNKYKVSFNKSFAPYNLYTPEDKDTLYTLKVIDTNGKQSSKNFIIHWKVTVPPLDFACEESSRLNVNYISNGKTYCKLGDITWGDFTLQYSLDPSSPALPSNTLTVNDQGASNGIGWLHGMGNVVSPAKVYKVLVVNNFGARQTKSFSLKVVNYCGDGEKQAPNGEGRGGINNDGYEDCDGGAPEQGVTDVVANSSINLQYGCVTHTGSSTPNPILTNNYCIYKSPTAGGGYCGDGFCQKKINGVDMENCWECPVDCGVCQTTQSLSNSDFETVIPAGTMVNGRPLNWDQPLNWNRSMMYPPNAFVTSSNVIAHLGTKSLYLHSDPNLLYPGICNASTCENLDLVHGLANGVGPYTNDNSCKGGSSFTGTCYPNVDSAKTSLNNTLRSGYENRVMWASFYYDLSDAKFVVGERYFLSFWYKGTTSVDLSVKVTPNFGWDNPTWENPSYIDCTDGGYLCSTTYSGAPCNHCSETNLSSCTTGKWCSYAPAQNGDFDGMSGLPPIKAKRYASWTFYRQPFVFTSAMDRWVQMVSTQASATDISTNGSFKPLDICADIDHSKFYWSRNPEDDGLAASNPIKINGANIWCKRRVQVGIEMGYPPSTTGSGTDMWIDDFSLEKVIVQ